ncbi:hypothetical protein PR048_032006 [Dryococelus australis]|uniref:Uncharacterized protein n=1 Tax=Dryococelus australis TaxID=614101 RepID=A0ABQ9G9P3_9NEOP|nr:hypothetical protein PR048_032006 [Dryococelus australis]
MLRVKGKEYINSKGAVVHAKEFKGFSCNKVSLEDKQKFHELCYNSEYWEKQTVLIVGAVKCRNVERRRSGNKDKSKKQASRTSYMLPSDGDMKVCKNMFPGTLQIDSARIHRALLKVKSSTTSDLTGKCVPHGKSSSVTIELNHTHIKSFPTTTSHYTRSQTNIKQLGFNLNLSLMYRLFVEDMKEKYLI